VSGPLTWWANRKSRIGLSPAALKPPHVHGKEWWTTPPIAPPQPEHIEYVVQYLLELQRASGSRERNTLLAHASAWLRAARQLLHEQVESQRGDLHTTDGLIVAAERTLQILMCKCGKAGLLSADEDAEFKAVRQALVARADRVKRERAIEASKRATPRTVSDPPPITAEDIAQVQRESEQLYRAFEARTKGMERVEGRRRR
jgi:hypothetical protein